MPGWGDAHKALDAAMAAGKSAEDITLE